LNRVVRIGKAVDAEIEEGAVSGWMGKRIEEFRKRQKECVPAWELNS